METNQKDLRGNNYKNDHRYYEEDNNQMRTSKTNYLYDNNNMISANAQKTSFGSSSKNNINLNYNYFTDFSGPFGNNNENRELKGILKI